MNKLIKSITLIMVLLISTTSNSTASEVLNPATSIGSVGASAKVVKVTSVVLTPKSMTLPIGETEIIIAKLLPTNAPNETITWKSSKPTIITVDVYGFVTAVSPGKAVVTVTTESGKKASCTVTVPKPSKAGQIAEMRSHKISPPSTINARIHNLIIEVEIHKLRYESESKFKSIVKGAMISGKTLTIKAKQYNAISTQLMNKQVTDDAAIAQLQALSLVP